MAVQIGDGSAAADEGKLASVAERSRSLGASVLAERLMAALVNREPGWQLPRLSDLARRYEVNPQQIAAAIEELAARQVVRRMPDGRLLRASPAQYLIPLGGKTAGLRLRIEPAGGKLEHRDCQISGRRVPDDIATALGLPVADAAAVTCLWVLDGQPAAWYVSYLNKSLAGAAVRVLAASPGLLMSVLDPEPDPPAEIAGDPAPAGTAQIAALLLEVQNPQPSVARALRLGPGQPAALVSARHEDPGSGRLAALTVVTFRADMFRIVAESRPAPGHAEGAGQYDCSRSASLWRRYVAGPAAPVARRITLSSASGHLA